MADTLSSPDVREKLRQIRDSDHPASKWARNVVEMLDSKSEGEAIDIAKLGWNVAMLERRMAGWSARDLEWMYGAKHLTPDEIASIFGLGGNR